MATDETYIGDGVYASFDGYQICLRAPRDFGNDHVYLEPNTFKNLLEYVENIKAKAHAS